MTGDMSPQIQWFGADWGTALNQETRHAPTPVDQACARCDEPVVMGDRGVLMWHVTLEGSGYRPLHFACYVRGGVGGIDHVLHHGLGDCTGACAPDPDWLTRREAAEIVARLIDCLQRRQPA